MSRSPFPKPRAVRLRSRRVPRTWRGISECPTPNVDRACPAIQSLTVITIVLGSRAISGVPSRKPMMLMVNHHPESLIGSGGPTTHGGIYTTYINSLFVFFRFFFYKFHLAPTFYVFSTHLSSVGLKITRKSFCTRYLGHE